MKKILWALSVVLLIATRVSADIRSDKCNTYSNDMGISTMLDNYSGDICVWAGSIADDQGNICYQQGERERRMPHDQSDTPVKTKKGA